MSNYPVGMLHLTNRVTRNVLDSTIDLRRLFQYPVYCQNEVLEWN